jgi:ATP-dependent Clp protease ATP-binding subunit ClpB
MIRPANRYRAGNLCLILLDEIEKAHPEVLTCSSRSSTTVTSPMPKGGVDFRNTIIIMTSNVGSDDPV